MADIHFTHTFGTGFSKLKRFFLGNGKIYSKNERTLKDMSKDDSHWRPKC